MQRAWLFPNPWRRVAAAGGALVALGITAPDPASTETHASGPIIRMPGEKTLEDRLRYYGPAARQRWRPVFEAVGLRYPPQELTLVGLKAERALEVYARDGGAWQFLHRFPVLAASGELGPKLQQGDRQVPEGLYEIESLNPNSKFHLSLRVNYPNEADRAQARTDGRRDLGGDIMIHGRATSTGCLAVGDWAIENLFILVADTGPEATRVILSPVDFRVRTLPPDFTPEGDWVTRRHLAIAAALRTLPFPYEPAREAFNQGGARGSAPRTE
ncbi:MAG: L,D-transpeptidase family protein [Myxococcota bacterium]